MLKIGDKPQNFTLPDQAGLLHSLSDYLGKKLVIYFYPKDDTPGCTTEACGFRDNLPEFEKLKVTVLGISKDSSQSHSKFSEKFALNFPILSDESLEVIKNFSAWGPKKFMGKSYEGILRTTFILDENGVIIKIYENVKPDSHAQEILDFLEN